MASEERQTDLAVGAPEEGGEAPRPDKGSRNTFASRAQRQPVEEGDEYAERDYYATPPWAARALCESLLDLECDLTTAWEPACGEGHLVRGLIHYFDRVVASDLYETGFGHNGIDFYDVHEPVDWIITNPPFGDHFVPWSLHALSLARKGVALLARSQITEGRERFREVWTPHPPTRILQFVERVPITKGAPKREATTATAYCWILWLKPIQGPTIIDWIPPCRERLELAADYD